MGVTPAHTLGPVIGRLRAWQPSAAAVRRAFLATLVTNAGIVVTGGAVRLTSSGLGCPTFPRCTDRSLVVTGEMGAHGLVEFGNRMLTFALSAVVAVAIVTAWRVRRADLLRSGWLMFAGIVAQALLGGVTVLTGLNPATVMAHFLLSMVLIAVATHAYERSCGVPVAPQPRVRRDLLIGGRLLVVVVAATLVAGTVVTGTGPHSGDKHATHRFPFNLLEVTQLHADLVFLLVGLALGLTVALRATASPPDLQRRALVLIGTVMLQGAIGYTQYFLDVPVGLVMVHVLGATLVWIATLQLLLGMTERVSAVVPAARRPGRRADDLPVASATRPGA
ncbi:MAG: heme a synthase [Actinomycetota bacterium]|nr:heme a synthase [Actinomycetota bacterium]